MRVAFLDRVISWRDVGAGALVILLIAVPPIVLARLARGEGPVRSNLWVLAVVGLFAGFAMGGRTVARRRPDLPVLHSAAAATVAFGLLAGYAVVRRLATGEGISLAVTITLLVLLQVNLSVAALSGYVTARRQR
jgi:hypothetical protein